MSIIGVILFIMGAVLVIMCFSGKADVTDFEWAIGLFAIGFFMMLADAEHSQSYKAVVTDFNGNQTTYNVRRYYTDGEKSQRNNNDTNPGRRHESCRPNSKCYYYRST